MGVLLIAVILGFVATNDGLISQEPEIVVTEPAVTHEPIFERERFYDRGDYLITDLSKPPVETCYELEDGTADVPNTIRACDIEEQGY